MKEIIEQINAFDILKRLNEEDAKNKTLFLPVFNYFVSGEKVRRGAHITMGVDAGTWMDVFHNKRRCILLCIDNEAYKRVENELILESQQGKEEKEAVRKSQNVRYKWGKLIASKLYDNSEALLSKVECQELIEDMESIYTSQYKNKKQ